MASRSSQDAPPRLSDFVEPTTRRGFLANASMLSLAIPGVGAAIAACSPGSEKANDTANAGAIAAPPQSAGSPTLHNPDSRLDTALLKGGHPISSAGGITPSATVYKRFDPALPPLGSGNLKIHWRTKELPIRISDDTVVAAWTFEGDIPGPVVHCRVGDTVEFTLTNDVDVPHSMDFHAAQIDPKHAFRSVPKGESVTYTFKPKWAGAFLYHCGSSPVLMHIGSGMYGAIVVSPREPLPPAKEFVLIQSEYYLGDAVGGIRPFDYNKMLATFPDYVMFNGRPNQYMKDPIKVKVGDRVRFWVVNAGPTHPCNFHVVGEQFDTVYLGSPPGSAIHGVQTWDVAAGGGMCFEMLCDVPGEFPVVNHGFGHGQKGGIGILMVEP
ncbi:MAG: multicopper oxidase domain-containing protein [Gemmatimonadales bacterium]